MEPNNVPSFDIELLRNQLLVLKNFEKDLKQVHINALKKFDDQVAGAYLSKGSTLNEETTVMDQQKTLVDVTNRSRTLKPKHTVEPSSPKDILNTPFPLPKIIEPSKPSRKRPSSPIEINEPDPTPINLNMPSTSQADIVGDHTYAVEIVSEQSPERDTPLVELPKSAKKKVGAFQKPMSSQKLQARRPCTPTTNPLVLKESSSTSKLAVKHNIRPPVNKSDNETYKKILQDCQTKKDMVIRAKTEALKKKNEDKLKKAHALRDAAEKDKLAQLAKLEMEKKIKAKQLLDEKEKQKEEILMKKKIHQQKAQEAEERRLKEEAARLAKLQEQEKEQKRLEEQRIKEQQDAEKLKQQRKLQEEKQMKELNSKKDQSKIESIYDDNAEVEKNKNTLAWSRDQMDAVLVHRSLYASAVLQNYFGCKDETPNLKKFFGKYAQTRVRTSSASWNTTAQYLQNEQQD